MHTQKGRSGAFPSRARCRARNTVASRCPRRRFATPWPRASFRPGRDCARPESDYPFSMQSKHTSHADGSVLNPKRPEDRADLPAGPSNLEKDPDDWVTGDEPMTGAQASYLKTLSEEAHDDFAPALTKADASKRIAALQAKTGRGHHQ